MPTEPATSFPEAGKLLNALAGLSAAQGAWPLLNMKMSKMTRIAISLISPMASRVEDSRTSKKVSSEISTTMPRASQGQPILTPNAFTLRFAKYANPPASDASNTEYATTAP